MTEIHGTVARGFERMRATLEEQFAGGQHVGAGVAVYHRGRAVVDLWGGLADEAAGTPWQRDTMAVCYSTTKGLAATCVHVLADRALIDYEAPVATYWPEYAQNGKEGVTVYHLLTHQSGSAPVPRGLTTDDLDHWDRIEAALAQEAPAWTPGEASGYHALTFGWLMSALVRKVDGRSIGRFFADEIAAPLGLEHMYIGAPADAEPLIARLENRMEISPEMEKQREVIMGPDTLIGRAMIIEAGKAGRLDEVLNSARGHAMEVPAVSGVMTARDLARFYACLANYGELDGVRILSEATVRKMSAVQTRRPDRVMMLPVGWSMGYMNGGAPGWPQGPRATSFGHPGLGGSVGFADPEIGMSFGFVLNALGSDLIGAGRAAQLADAARVCVESNEAVA